MGRSLSSRRVDLTTGGAVHDMPDQRHLLGPPDAPPPPAAGRPDADETAQRVGNVHRGLTGAASQVRWSHDTPGGHMTRLSHDMPVPGHGVVRRTGRQKQEV